MYPFEEVGYQRPESYTKDDKKRNDSTAGSLDIFQVENRKHKTAGIASKNKVAYDVQSKLYLNTDNRSKKYEKY